jgi:hypothetical protein
MNLAFVLVPMLMALPSPELAMELMPLTKLLMLMHLYWVVELVSLLVLVQKLVQTRLPKVEVLRHLVKK